MMTKLPPLPPFDPTGSVTPLVPHAAASADAPTVVPLPAVSSARRRSRRASSASEMNSCTLPPDPGTDSPEGERPESEFLTAADAAQVLQTPVRTLLLWLRDGRGPRAIRLPNGKLRIRRQWLEAWIETFSAEVA